jgi:hypothetical protein
MPVGAIALSAALALGPLAHQDTAATACPVTSPNHHAPPTGSEPLPPGAASLWYGNASVGTALWPDGRVVFRPGGAGTVLPDGRLQMKFFWLKRPGLAMRVAGSRVDDASVRLGAEVSDAFTPEGMQPSLLIFATPGCWRVTATVGAEALTFVTEVVKVGQGSGGR